MSNRQATVLVAALACAGSLAVTPAEAQVRSLEKSYFAVKPMFGVGGEVELEVVGTTFEDDLTLSFGGGLAYMARLHRHFALGVLLALQSWQSEAADDAGRDRNLYIDGAIVPAGVWPVSRDVELYAALGLGLSMDFVGDDGLLINVPVFGTAAGLEIDEALGFVLLPVLGARFALSSDVGVLVELGYSLRSYEHDVIIWTDVITGASVREALDVSLGQVALNLGVFF